MEEQIYLSQPQVTGDEMKYIQKAFSTNNLTLFGDNLIEFEERIAQFVGAKTSLATNCGTAALHLALRYAGVEKGDLVFCSSLTFAASCNPVLYQGGIPVFIDSERETWNMSPKALEKAFFWAEKEGKMPKAAVIVDLYGQPADYDALLPIFREYKVPVIEDAAEALGSTYNGKQCGTFGDYGAFSFNSNKIITTGGGGMVVSDDEDAIAKMRYWAAQAREPLPYYEHKEYGYQYRMSNILAGIGCGQVSAIDRYAKRRQDIYEAYEKAFVGYPITMMPKNVAGNPNCWLSVILLESKELPLQLIHYLGEHNIESRMVWKPMHLQPIYRQYPYFKEKDTDVSKDLFERGVCLPSASVMTKEEQQKVIDLTIAFLTK